MLCYFPHHPKDAYQVVCPHFLGYGLSSKPKTTGTNVHQQAQLFDQLMQSLGYTTYFAQGGDWGSAIARMMAALSPSRCVAVHVNCMAPRPNAIRQSIPDTEEEKRMQAKQNHYLTHNWGYGEIQMKRPQTIGYALADSPVGQMAWMLEHFILWSKPTTDGLSALSMDAVLDQVMLYWLTNSSASSARLYWEAYYANPMSNAPILAPCDTPFGYMLNQHEVSFATRAEVEALYKHIILWQEYASIGHFAAMEDPKAFVQSLQDFQRAYNRYHADK